MPSAVAEGPGQLQRAPPPVEAPGDPELLGVHLQDLAVEGIPNVDRSVGEHQELEIGPEGRDGRSGHDRPLLRGGSEPVKSRRSTHEASYRVDGADVAREIVLWFEIPSELEALDDLWTAVASELQREVQLQEKTLLDFRLALMEAASNAIVHGHGEDGRPLAVEVVAGPQRLEAAVHDSGPGFQMPGSAALPDADAEHGRGLWMMEHLLDEVRYERTGADNVMRLCLGPLGLS